MGVDYQGTGIINFSAVSEYRGNSYAMGIDTGAVTLPNFVKKYNSKVQGGSVLSHLASFCNGDTCDFPETICKWKKKKGCSSEILISLNFSIFRSSFEG